MTGTYKTKEIAEILGVTPEMVCLWCRTGKLTAYKIGTDYRIPKSKFEEYLEECEKKARKNEDSYY